MRGLTGVMGGMFDPVHAGHLRAARAAREACRLDEVLLLPCGNPVHRDPARTGAAHRCRMLELAIAGQDWLRLDTRECDSAAPSRTFDSLSALRAERPDEILYFILGLDAFNSLPRWYRWRELFSLAHLLVVTRPGYRLRQRGSAENEAGGEKAGREETAEIEVELLRRRVTDPDRLAERQAGGIYLVEADTPELSSSQLRAMLENGQSGNLEVPAPVRTYIETHKLYQRAE